MRKANINTRIKQQRALALKREQDITNHMTRIMRLPEVLQFTGLTYSQISTRCANGTFPKKIPLGKRNIGWSYLEVSDWLDKNSPERIPQTLDYLRFRIVKAFHDKWKLNDPAHRLEHFLEVEACGEFINETLGLGYNRKLILYTAFFHDLFAWSRENHHRLAHSWLMSTEHPILMELSDDEIHLVANASLYHRASNKSLPDVGFIQLMNAADRGFPDNKAIALYKRASEFTKHKQGTKDLHETVVKHLKDKFGSQGYACYPEFYTKVFAVPLNRQRKVVDAM